MKRRIALTLGALTGAFLFSIFCSSCKTLDDPSPHTQKVREKGVFDDPIQRHHRHRRH